MNVFAIALDLAVFFASLFSPRHINKAFRVDLGLGDNKTIQSPGYYRGLYREHVEYSWDISAPSPTVIHLLFEDLQVERHPYCEWDRVELYSTRCNNKSKHPIRRLCGIYQNYSFTSLSNVLCIILITDRWMNKRGFKASISVLKGNIKENVTPMPSPVPGMPSTSTVKSTQEPITPGSTKTSTREIVPSSTSSVSQTTSTTLTIFNTTRATSSTSTTNTPSEVSSTSKRSSTLSSPFNSETTNHKSTTEFSAIKIILEVTTKSTTDSSFTTTENIMPDSKSTTHYPIVSSSISAAADTSTGMQINELKSEAATNDSITSTTLPITESTTSDLKTSTVLHNHTSPTPESTSRASTRTQTIRTEITTSSSTSTSVISSNMTTESTTINSMTMPSRGKNINGIGVKLNTVSEPNSPSNTSTRRSTLTTQYNQTSPTTFTLNTTSDTKLSFTTTHNRHVPHVNSSTTKNPISETTSIFITASSSTAPRSISKTTFTIPKLSTIDTSSTTTISQEVTLDSTLNTTDAPTQSSTYIPESVSTTSSRSNTESYHDNQISVCSSSSIELHGLSGSIESPQAIESITSSSNTLCKWEIKPSTNQVVIIVFEVFAIKWSAACHRRKVSIYTKADGEWLTHTVLCGDTLPETLVMHSDVMVEFSSDETAFIGTFNLKYFRISITTQSEISACQAGFYPCVESNTCIPVEWVCDGDNDCRQSEDEESCEVCGAQQFDCGQGECINPSLHCDGQSDCPNGLDEQACFTKDAADIVSTIVKGQRLPLCYMENYGDIGDKICNNLGYRESASVMPVVLTSTEFAVPKTNTYTKNMANYYASDTCPYSTGVRLQCLEQECGRKPYEERTKRIVGGSSSSDGEWPWIVAIQIEGQVVCGGTIVSADWVVTAGHCVYNYMTRPYTVSVIAGVNDVLDNKRRVYNVSEIVVHPNYEFIYNSDVAMIKLRQPILLRTNIQPLCLPWHQREFSTSSRCFVAGWGIADVEDYYKTFTPTVLKHTKTKLWQQHRCKSIYSYKMTIQDHMFCAGYAGGTMDSCKGDSGGPLMCEEDHGHWALVGVVSWGELCGTSLKPGVYTKVTSFIPWIQNVTVNKANVNCSFNAPSWCGYSDLSANSHVWFRKTYRSSPGDYFLYGAPVGDTADVAKLVSPVFFLKKGGCLTFMYTFSAKSNTTLTVYGHSSRNIDRGDTTKLWTISSHYPSSSTWHITETSVPRAIRKFTFVASYDRTKDVFVGLDNIVVSEGLCNKYTSSIQCDFNNQSFCGFSTQEGAQLKPWIVQENQIDTNDYFAFAGGTLKTFGYLSTAQLLSPYLQYEVTKQTVCLQFSIYKTTQTNNELEVLTYSSMSGYLHGRQVLWTTARLSGTGWIQVDVNILGGFYNHIGFEVTRELNDVSDIGFQLDNIGTKTGQCI